MQGAASVSNDSDSTDTVTAAPTAVVNTTAPSISPPTTPKAGVELTAAPGEWTPADGVSFTYQWMRGTEEITDATNATYTPTVDDVDAKLSVKVTGAVDGLDSATATSPETDTVTDVDLSEKSIPTIAGVLKVGQELTGTPATFNGHPTSIDNQWFAGTEEITGATETRYTLTEDKSGKTITFKSTAKRGSDTPVTSASTPSAVVQAADAPVAVSKAATASGIATVGETLTGTPAEFTGNPAPSVKNQWQANGADITGATASTYKVTADDLNKTITFVSTATQGATELPSISNEIGPIKAVLKESKKATVSGTPQVGKMLAGTEAEFNDPTATVTNQWFANGKEIEGQTGTKYTLTTAELGKTITFKSTATRGEETASSTSDATAKVKAGNGGSTPPPPNASDPDGGITVLPSTTIAQGADTTIDVGTDYAGEKVTVWLFTKSYNLGTFTVKDNGRIAVTIPKSVAPGKHRIVVLDSHGDRIGLQSVTITAKAATGLNPVVTVPVSSGSSSGLPATGSDTPLYLVPLGLLMLVAGGTALVVTRRRHEEG